ncbi:MAG: AzlD domain-containing protein [Acholeplasmatales bacterium]|nr:AzlD domain-containing protein [Acholeplasmatales bacterium]
MYNFIAVLIMSLVTYIPRALPIAFFKKKIKSQFINSFLFYVPYAVLACLTFPGIFFFTDNIILATVGTLTAITLALFKQKLFVVTIVSVLVVFGLEFLLR